MLGIDNEIFRISGNTLPIVVAILAATFFITKWFNSQTYQLKHIPTVGGSSSVVLSYFSALRYYFHGQDMMQEGYDKYYGSAFKVPTMSRWFVIVSGQQMINDVRRASDVYMSLEAFDIELLQVKYTSGHAVMADPWQTKYTRAPLARQFTKYQADIKDEIFCAVDELLTKENHQSRHVTGHKFAMRIIARAVSRLFVGLPLCRNSEYLKFSENSTTDAFRDSQILNMFPKILHPIFGLLIEAEVSKSVKRIRPYIRPLFEAYIMQKKQYGDSENSKLKENLITWLTDEAQESGRPIDIEDFTRRVLAINFLAIGSVAAALVDALFNLSVYPKYAAPMRDEIEAIVEAEGWTKDSVAKMYKVDSFLKETQRIGTGGTTGNRKLLKDFTFSNGISLPAGTFISFASHSIHRDARHYELPAAEFRGFRFADMMKEDDNISERQAVSLTPEYLIFGTGRHACPGRFFAIYMLKLALAYIVLNYDVECAPGGSRPKSSWFQAICFPDTKAELVFRKRM